MAKLNLSQAAKAVGIHRSTIHRHIDEGKISSEVIGNGKKVVDTSELLRVYGQIKEIATPATVSQKDAMQQQATPNETVATQDITTISELKDGKIKELEYQVQELRIDRDERKEREKGFQQLITEQQKTISQQLMLLKAPEPEPTEQQATSPVQDTNQTAAGEQPKDAPNPVSDSTPVKKQGRLSKWFFGNREVTNG